MQVTAGNSLIPFAWKVNTRAKNAMLQGMQNAVSYVQMQAAGLLHAQQLYDRMSVLATRA